jgi:hypothetical protein
VGRPARNGTQGSASSRVEYSRTGPRSEENKAMAHALNLTFKIKQDAETLQKLQDVKKVFASQIQPAIDSVLTSCKLVHFARILVIDDRYMMVLTEYDGDHLAYTEFFRVNLPDVFKMMFSLAEGAPPWDQINNQDDFFNASKVLQVRSLGESTTGEPDANGGVAGYLFSAYGQREVKDILAKLAD